MKKKILMILPLFLAMFFAGQMVHAQSFVASSVAIPLLETEYASAKTELNQATPGSVEYQLAEDKLNYYSSLIEGISNGTNVQQSLNSANEKASLKLGSNGRRNSPQANNLKVLFSESRDLLQQ